MKTDFLLFTLEYPPQKGGVANYYENLVNRWPEADMFVLAPVAENTPRESSHVQRKKLLASKIRPRWLPCFWHLWRAIRHNDIDHVLVGQLLPLGTVTYYLAKLLKIRYTVFLHGMDLNFAFRSRRKGYISRKILRSADAIICSNSYVLELAEEKAGGGIRKKGKVVNPGIPATPPYAVNFQKKEELKKELGLADKFVILTLGRLVKRKGVDKVIEALSRMEGRQDMVYVVAGTGPEENYLKQIKENSPYKDQIKFTGSISEEEKWNLLDLCDILVMPAREIDGDFEGFGIVYLEANQAGKPVVAGRSGGVPDAVENGENGLMVNPEDPEAIKQAILKLYKDKDLRRKLGQQGRQRARQEFNWNRQIRKIYKFLN